MPVAVVYNPDGTVRDEHERDTVQRAWLSAVGAGTYTRPAKRRKPAETVSRYEPGTTIRVDDQVHRRWTGTEWVDITG
jgi:hypothetical protein